MSLNLGTLVRNYGELQLLEHVYITGFDPLPVTIACILEKLIFCHYDHEPS